MRHFNTSITKILEAVDLDLDDDDTEDIRDIQTKGDKYTVAKTVLQFKKDKIDQDKAGRMLVAYATETEENKPLAVAADFIDILNQSAKTSGTINTAALRKIAQNLNVRDGVLDALEPQDQALALKLIDHGIKQQEKTGMMGRGRKIGRE